MGHETQPMNHWQCDAGWISPSLSLALLSRSPLLFQSPFSLLLYLLSSLFLYSSGNLWPLHLFLSSPKTLRRKVLSVEQEGLTCSGLLNWTLLFLTQSFSIFLERKEKGALVTMFSRAVYRPFIWYNIWTKCQPSKHWPFFWYYSSGNMLENTAPFSFLSKDFENDFCYWGTITFLHFQGLSGTWKHHFPHM